MSERRHVVVVGLMGAGKSTVGRALASRLGWPFRDSDVDIEAATGQTVKELGAEEGVPAMHALEAEQLLDALEAATSSVISAAASTIDVEACRRRLDEPDVLVVWLRADPATLAARFGSSAHRPAYGPDPATFLADQAAHRYPLYEALHPVVVDVDALDPAGVLAAAVEGLARAGLRVPDAATSAAASVPDGPGVSGRMDLHRGDDAV